jgi:hypothetical protein
MAKDNERKTAPVNDAEWKALTKLSPGQAAGAGLSSWDGGLFLLPGDWYNDIPSWLEVECIDGEQGKWGDEVRDDDTRFGYLAYGLRLGHSDDDE